MRQILVVLQKARKGDMKSGHKYHSRRRDPKTGAWIYDYGHDQARASGGQPEQQQPEIREPRAPTFLATIDSDSIRSYMPAIPMLAPVSSWVRKAKFGDDGMVVGDIPAPKLPAHIRQAGVEIGADGGGFVAARVWGGEYRFTPKQYTDWLRKVKPTWAAMLDFCVEPAIAATPAEVKSRQEKTTANAKALWKKYKRAPWAWVPTVQGWSVEDYVRHARALKPLIDEMQAHYGPDAGFRVGVGTLCCRTSRKQIEAIINSVAQELPGVPLHLWGVKLDAFKSSIALPDTVISSDSAAWNQRFGADVEAYKESGLTQRQHAYGVALPDYLARVSAAHAAPKQKPIDLSHELYDWKALDPEKVEKPKFIFACPACGGECDESAWGAMEEDDRDDIRWHLELGVCPSCQSPLSDDEYIPPHKLPAPDPDLAADPEVVRRRRTLPFWANTPEGKGRDVKKVRRIRLKKPKEMTGRALSDLLGKVKTERMELSQARVFLALLQKARKGDIKPGHKYISRKRRKGKWVYDYAEAAQRQEALAGKLGGLKAKLQAQQAARQVSKPEQANALIVPRVPMAQKPRKPPKAPAAAVVTLAPEPVEETTLAGKLAAIERMICTRPLEEGHAFMPDGRRVIAKLGQHMADGGQGIYWSNADLKRMVGCIMTHNHPLTKEGTSLSFEDVDVALAHNWREVRSVGQRYRNSMKIPAKWPDRRPPTSEALFLSYQKHSRDVKKEMWAKIDRKEIPLIYAEVQTAHEIWLRVAPELGLDYSREEWETWES